VIRHTIVSVTGIAISGNQKGNQRALVTTTKVLYWTLLTNRGLLTNPQKKVTKIIWWTSTSHSRDVDVMYTPHIMHLYNDIY